MASSSPSETTHEPQDAADPSTRQAGLPPLPSSKRPAWRRTSFSADCARSPPGSPAPEPHQPPATATPGDPSLSEDPFDRAVSQTNPSFDPEEGDWIRRPTLPSGVASARRQSRQSVGTSDGGGLSSIGKYSAERSRGWFGPGRRSSGVDAFVRRCSSGGVSHSALSVAYGNDIVELDLAASLVPAVPVPRTPGGELDAFWEHVFVVAPKLCDFAHRSQFSTRHPASAHRVWAHDMYGHASQQRAVLSPGPAQQWQQQQTVAQRWEEAAAAHSPVADCASVRQRRREIFSSAAFQRICRRWWLHVTGDIGQAHNGIWLQLLPATQYAFVESRIHQLLCQPESGQVATLDAVAAWQQDWEHDRGEREGVSFPQYCLSLLELADTWTTTCAEEEYVALLGDVLQRAWRGHELAQFDAELQQLNRATVVHAEERARWLHSWGDARRQKQQARKAERSAARNRVPYRILAIGRGLPSPKEAAPGLASPRGVPTSPRWGSAGASDFRRHLAFTPEGQVPDIVLHPPGSSSAPRPKPAGWRRGTVPAPADSDLQQGPAPEGTLQLHAEGLYEAQDANGQWWDVTLVRRHRPGDSEHGDNPLGGSAVATTKASRTASARDKAGSQEYTYTVVIQNMPGTWEGVPRSRVRERSDLNRPLDRDEWIRFLSTGVTGSSMLLPRAPRVPVHCPTPPPHQKGHAFKIRGAWRPRWGIRGGGSLSAAAPTPVPAGPDAVPAEAVQVGGAPTAYGRPERVVPAADRPRRRRRQLPPEVVSGQTGAAVAAAIMPLWLKWRCTKGGGRWRTPGTAAQKAPRAASGKRASGPRSPKAILSPRFRTGNRALVTAGLSPNLSDDAGDEQDALIPSMLLPAALEW